MPFITVDKVDHSNARIVGAPSVITDASTADKIRQKIKAKISPEEAKQFQVDNPSLKSLDVEAVKTKMVE
jgi:hypothetical protein